MLIPGVDTFFSTQDFSFSEKMCVRLWRHRLIKKDLLGKQRKLTTENNYVKLPVAERLILVRYPSSETTRLPQGESQQNLALLLVEWNWLTVEIIWAVIVHSTNLGKKKLGNKTAAWTLAKFNSLWTGFENKSRLSLLLDFLSEKEQDVFSYRVNMDTVVFFVCKRRGVTGGVSILVPGFNLQSVLLAIC